MAPDVLTKSGPHRSYATKLAAYLNIDVKNVTRIFINQAYKHYQPVIEYKLKHGWVKDHVRADIEAFDFVESLMRHPLNQSPNMNGWPTADDPNNKMLRRLVLIHAAIRDEDSFYDILELVMDKWKHEHWDRYEKSAEWAYKLTGFPVLYANLLAHKEAIEEPLPDITDEPDDVKMDYIELEKRVKKHVE